MKRAVVFLWGAVAGALLVELLERRRRWRMFDAFKRAAEKYGDELSANAARLAGAERYVDEYRRERP